MRYVYGAQTKSGPERKKYLKKKGPALQQGLFSTEKLSDAYFDW